MESIFKMAIFYLSIRPSVACTLHFCHFQIYNLPILNSYENYVRINDTFRFFDSLYIIIATHSPTKNRSFSFRFSAVNNDFVLSLFPAHQVSKIILNESSKSTENASKKIQQNIFQNPKYMWFLW
jgi:hypothetical protein